MLRMVQGQLFAATTLSSTYEMADFLTVRSSCRTFRQPCEKLSKNAWLPTQMTDFSRQLMWQMRWPLSMGTAWIGD